MRDLYCSYYTNSKHITSYMVKKLRIKKNDIILEPSAGEGIFIDAILNKNTNIRIDALDINPDAINVLKTKYKQFENIHVRKTDTLLDLELDQYTNNNLYIKETDTLIDKDLDFFEKTGGYYTAVIGNPPYGAWQDYEKREVLKKKYSGHYVKETYTLFLLRCISVLRDKGRLSFIIPDTFLFLNMHSKLRELLLRTTKIEEILIFPSKFFSGVSFGYSNLSIITLERSSERDALNNSTRIIRGFSSPDEFDLLFSENSLPKHIETFEISQKETLANANSKFILAEKNHISVLNNVKSHLGDVANVVTGFYTGDNTKFIRVINKSVKGSKNYDVIDTNKIFDCCSLMGIENVDEGYIPYVKSSSKRKYTRNTDEWFVRWDTQTIEFYNKNKKSRFQNSSYYFKKGIAIPMVKSKTINAFLIERKVFDQSIVGIFPKDDSKTLYLLALMNSDIINEYLHLINPTANNSANYVKQLPYIEPDIKLLNDIQEKVSNIIECQKNNDEQQASIIHNEVNEIIRKIYTCNNNSNEL